MSLARGRRGYLTKLVKHRYFLFLFELLNSDSLLAMHFINNKHAYCFILVLSGVGWVNPRRIMTSCYTASVRTRLLV